MPQMFTRVLYTPAGTRPDFAAGRAKAALLVADATVDDLRIVVEERWLADQPACCPACHGRIHRTCHQQLRDIDQLRREVARRLDQLLAAAGATFGSWQVDRYRNDHGDQPGVEAHTTGGTRRR